MFHFSHNAAVYYISAVKNLVNATILMYETNYNALNLYCTLRLVTHSATVVFYISCRALIFKYV